MVANRCTPTRHSESCLTCTDAHAGWFCHLSPQALAEYDGLGMQMTVPAGGTLFYEGWPARNVHILCSGQIKLTASSKAGKTLLVRFARPGDVLGLSAAMSSTPYETTAQAVGLSQVKSFKRQDFLNFIERHLEGSMHAARMLNREYRDALSDATRLALSISISGRVARLFLDMAGSQTAAEPRFTLALSHEELATMLGTTRESVTRVLSEFKRKKIIAIHGTSVAVLRKEALELLA